MTTRPLGRAVATIRTPLLIREYLSGQPFVAPDGQQTTVVPAEGDYITHIHQVVKVAIRRIDAQRRAARPHTPPYQYPRHHSFVTLINHLIKLGLVEQTGRTEEPEEGGAGQLGSARGFQQRTWVRLVPGTADRPEWNDPIGYIAQIYPNVRPGIRPPVPGQPPEIAAPAPRRPRPRAPRAPVGPPPELVAQLENRRQTLVRRLQAGAEQGTGVAAFQALERAAAEFLRDTNEQYTRTPFPDAQEALTLVRSCIELLEAERELTQRRVQAIRNCRNSARLLAEALTSPLTPAIEPEPPAAPVERLELPEQFSTRSVSRLSRHLALLARLDPETVQDEIARIEQVVSQWHEAALDALAAEEDKESPDEERLERLSERAEMLDELENALGDLDLEQAIRVLGEG